ncbi:MAG: hypothetical protein ABJL99_05720 [Aliishimia sp.]
MMTRNRPLKFGRMAIAFGMGAAALYTLMITITLAYIETASGMIAFDMRPLGYTPDEAAQLLEALGAPGRRYYLTRQIPIDLAYPAMLAMTLVCTLSWLGAVGPNTKFVTAGIVVSIGAAMFDYVENFGIVAMISTWPNLPHPLVTATSTASVLKSFLTVAAVLSLLCLGAVRAAQFQSDHKRPLP